ncbi:HtaA domain-containing protein [Corynebacterium diphtheriae]|uniref:HtaA domain-containing protein n=1 Tax=Corynebacterium diphtheriae TaxID=1717 RepID=UPI0018C9195F|nr:HtaA domain-containing protein [Corynebacterium diphtheriae]MBG9344636.1 HtaA domain-containing protein [Corynebacterium diphtheriae bv. gravis]MBG9351729.1 HtaA domain-containing protein [Corynebacterium diphtheriae bv. gravis]
MASVQRSRFTYLLTTATIAALLPLAPVTAAAEDVEKPVTIATSGKLNWGIRESFNNYTNGASKVEDGAKLISTNNFEFKLEKATYDATKERTEAQFRGKITYLKYCDDNKSLTGCKLDLTIKDPKIVISNEDNFIEAEVNSKQYPSGEWFRPDGSQKIANLYPGSATVETVDGVTTWKNIVSALAAPAGVTMFSEFYGENEGLAPLSFSYDGAGAKPSMLKGGYIQSGGEWKSPQVYTDGFHKMVDLGDAILVAVGKKGFYLLDNNLRQLKELEVPQLGQVKVGTYDPDSHIYYYVESNNPKELMAFHVSSSNLDAPYKVAVADNPIHNIGYHPVTKKLVIITENATNSDITKINERVSRLGVLSGSSFTYQDLPSAQKLFPEELSGTVTGIETPYAKLMEFYKDTPEFLPMPDGTFILSSSSDITNTGENAKETLKSTLLSIKPGAQQHDADPLVKVMKGSRSDDARLAKVTSVHSNGDLVVRFNEFAHRSSSFGQILRYKDRDLVDISGPVGSETTGFSGWANAGFTPDGKVIIQSGEEGKLTWYDPSSKEWDKDHEIRLPRGRQTYELPHGTFIVRKDGTIIVPNYDKSDEFKEVYSLVKLVDSSKPPAVKESDDESALEKLKNDDKGSEGSSVSSSGSSPSGFSWSNVLGKLSTVLSIMIAAFGIGSMLAKIFNIRIPGIR